MKKIWILPLLCIEILLATACEKEDLHSYPKVWKAVSDEPVLHCDWSPCDLAIEATKQACQSLANSLCDTVWVDITCCQDGEVTLALVWVAPCSPNCTDVADPVRSKHEGY